MNLSVKLAAAIGLALAAQGALAQDVTLRFHHFISPNGTVPALFMAPWSEKIEQESGGRIDIEIFPGMQLGGAPPAIYDQIRDGVVDGGWALPAYTPGRFPETEVFELPFMTGLSAEASSKAAWDFTERYLQERLSDIKVLAVHVHGPGVIHTKGDPIRSLSDFEGLKLRGPSRQVVTLLENLGASPVGMPVPAFPEALAKGVVDGGLIPFEIVPGLKVHELADSHTQISGDRSLYNTFFIWGMNRASYDNLPDDLRAIIDANSGRTASAWAGRAMDKGDAAAIKVIKGSGNELYTLDPATVQELRTLSEAQTAAWIKEVTAKGLPGQEMVDYAKSLVEKYSK